jgi:hypothetical protein
MRCARGVAEGSVCSSGSDDVSSVPGTRLHSTTHRTACGTSGRARPRDLVRGRTRRIMPLGEAMRAGAGIEPRHLRGVG